MRVLVAGCCGRCCVQNKINLNSLGAALSTPSADRRPLLDYLILRASVEEKQQ
jgi:hypothetical protein